MTSLPMTASGIDSRQQETTAILTRAEPLTHSALGHSNPAPKPWPVKRWIATATATMNGVKKNDTLQLIKDRNRRISSVESGVYQYTVKADKQPKRWLTEIARNTVMADKRGYSARDLSKQFQIAVAKHDWEVVATILNHLDSNKRTEVLESIGDFSVSTPTRQGTAVTVYAVVSAIKNALHYPTSDLINTLLGSIPTEKLCASISDDSLVQLAKEGLRTGRPEFVLSIIEKTARTQNATCSVLSIATSSNYPPAVLKFLLDAGFDPNVLSHTVGYRGGVTPIQIIFERHQSHGTYTQGYENIGINNFISEDDLIKLKILLEYGANVNQLSSSGLTALHYAVMSRADSEGIGYSSAEVAALDRCEGIRFLIEHGACPYIAGDNIHGAHWFASNHRWFETYIDMYNTEVGVVSYTGHPKAKELFREIEPRFLALVETHDHYPFIDHWTGKEALSIEDIQAFSIFEEKIKTRQDWREFEVYAELYADIPKDQRLERLPMDLGQVPYDHNQTPLTTDSDLTLDFDLMGRVIRTANTLPET